VTVPECTRELRTRAVEHVSLKQAVGSDHELARLLQIGVVLEEVVEARAGEHYATLGEADRDPDIVALLDEAATESAEHRERLEALLADLEVESVPLDEVERLVRAQYEADRDFDGVLYDQLCNEETAYKFYDDLIAAIEGTDRTFGIDRARLLRTLRDLREEEADGVEEVTQLMEARD
jgi:rubrerythrin